MANLIDAGRAGTRIHRLSLRVLGVTLVMALGACAFSVPVPVAVAVPTFAPVSADLPWAVEPILHVTNTGVGADQGYMALARRYELESHWREARDAWRKAAAEAPNDAQILNELGIAEAGQGEYANSVIALQRAVERAPERVALRNNLGYALLLNGQEAQAGMVLREVLKRDPKHHQARANLDRINRLAMARATAAGKKSKNILIKPGLVRTHVASGAHTTPLHALQVTSQHAKGQLSQPVARHAATRTRGPAV